MSSRRPKGGRISRTQNVNVYEILRFALNDKLWIESSQEPFTPLIETEDALFTKAGNAFQCLLNRLFAVKVSLGEELVGKANHLFFQRNGDHFAMGNRKFLCLDSLQGDAGTSVAFAYQSMAREAFLTHQFRAQITMANVRMRSMAMNAGSIGQENTDIVKQSGFFEELTIEVQFGMTVGYPKRLVGHRTTVCEQDMLQFIVLGVIFVDDC